MADNYVSIEDLRNMSESTIPMLIPRRMLNSDMSQFFENPTMFRKRTIIILRHRHPPVSEQDGFNSDSPAPMSESSNSTAPVSESSDFTAPVSQSSEFTVPMLQSSNLAAGSSNSAGKLELFLLIKLRFEFYSFQLLKKFTIF